MDLFTLFLVISGFLIIFVNLASLYLFKIIPSLKTDYKINEEPLVSIIIPAKYESHNIERCLFSILNSDYKNKEIIVVAGDRETEVLASKFKNVKVIKEPPLPSGWVGKNWACYIGYKNSKGEYLLFTDADTVHSKETLKLTISKCKEENIGLLTLIPGLIMESIWVKSFLPIIGQFIVIYTLAPYANNDSSKFVFGNGQFLLFKREVYEKIGTHEAVKDEILEDFQLAKLVKSKGCKLRVYNGLKILKVRMYTNLKEMINGWSKNLYLGLGAKIYNLILSILLLTLIYLFPFFSLFIGLYFYLYYNQANLLFWSLIINLFYLFRFGIIYYKLNINFIYSFQYFIPIILFIYLLIKSYIAYKKGIIWKGRIYHVRI
jgi:Glycosyltransferases, probably involved in cell wall biogenesis